MDDDTAAILMVESNFQQRQEISLSEKAFAYKIQLEALKIQGKRTDLDLWTSCPQVDKSRDEIGNQNSESGRQIQRYIRLTNGNGCNPNAMGHSVWADNVITGEHLAFYRHDFLGVLRPDIESNIDFEAIKMNMSYFMAIKTARKIFRTSKTFMTARTVLKTMKVWRCRKVNYILVFTTKNQYNVNN